MSGNYQGRWTSVRLDAKTIAKAAAGLMPSRSRRNAMRARCAALRAALAGRRIVGLRVTGFRAGEVPMLELRFADGGTVELGREPLVDMLLGTELIHGALSGEGVSLTAGTSTPRGTS